MYLTSASYWGKFKRNRNKKVVRCSPACITLGECPTSLCVQLPNSVLESISMIDTLGNLERKTEEKISQGTVPRDWVG